MTDRETLELAARAAGYVFGEYGGKPARQVTTKIGAAWIYWNPREDDGDALRLAGKLSFTVNIWNMARKTFAGDGESGIGWTEPHGANADAATRLAIFRAAAEIGKQMEETK